LKLKDGGHDYVIQITDARPDTGGLSGATIQEGKSWGKIKTSHKNNVIVYGDSSICFPIIAAYVLSECKKRPTKRLLSKKNAWVEDMKKEYLKDK
jgi:deoxyhypusine synthase